MGKRLSVEWLIPVVLFAAVCWPALQCFYFADDFAWLSIARLHAEGQSLAELIFKPASHGTWRPFSERLTFYLEETLFPGNPLPFHLLVFLTQAANLVLLYRLTLRLTGSRVAAVAAPVLWTVNPNLSQALSWSSAYMQILCGFCILAALSAFIEYMDSGKRVFLAVTWVIFLFGFGVMETNLVFPALAGLCAWVLSRRHLRTVIPFAVVSALFVGLHMALAPKQAEGLYSISLSPVSVSKTVALYLMWCFRPANLQQLQRIPGVVTAAWAAAAFFALAGVVVWSAWRREWRPAVLAGFYFVLVAPVAPLGQHHIPYYVTLGAMGVAMVGGWAIAAAWRSGVAWRAVAAVLLAGWVLIFPIATFRSVRWWRDLSWRVRGFVEEVARIRSGAPGKAIVVTGIAPELYWQCLHHNCAYPLRLEPVLVAGDWAVRMGRESGFALNPAHFADDGVMHGDVVLHSFAAPGAADAASAVPGPPRLVETANPANAQWLGEGWHPAESGFRWMSLRATVTVAGPAERLVVEGYCPDVVGRPKSSELSVGVNGVKSGVVKLAGCRGEFREGIEIPERLRKEARYVVELRVSEGYRVTGDARALGVVIGKVGVEP